MRKLMLSLFHEKQICRNSCSQKYPWGWKSKTTIYSYTQHIKNKKIMVNKNIKEFDEHEFLKNSVHAYNRIYRSYLNNEDFLDYQYTTPKLSLALNDLRQRSCTERLSSLTDNISVQESKILSNKIENEITTNNFKFLGYYNVDEIIHQIIAGAIGPEARYIWDQLPLKQKVNVLYKSDNYYDIIEWERDLSEEEPEWHVCNINKII